MTPPLTVALFGDGGAFPGLFVESLESESGIEFVHGDATDPQLRNGTDVKCIAVPYPYEPDCSSATVMSMVRAEGTPPVVLVGTSCTPELVDESVALTVPYLALDAVGRGDRTLSEYFEAILSAHERGTDPEIDARPDLFDRIQHGILSLSTERVLTRANDDIHEFLHLPSDVIGRSADDVFGDHPTGILNLLETATATGTTQFTETYDEAADRWLSIAVQPHDDEVFVAVRDVTERKRRELDLERTRLITETMVDGVYVLDPEYRFEFVNSALADLTGYDRAELLDADLSRIIAEDDIERGQTVRSHLKAGRQSDAVMAADVHRKDGTTVLCEFRFAPILQDDRFEGTVGLVTDISERTRWETELRESEDYWRAVFNGSLDAAVVADENGRYVDANDAACELFGLPRDDLIGRSISGFADPTFRFDDAWNRFQDATAERGLFRLLRPDGTTRIVEYAATSNVVDGRHLSILRDVTDRQLRIQRLQVLQRILRHNLRNELTIIDGHLEDLRTKVDGEPVERHVDTVLSVTKELLSLSETVNNVQKSLDREPRIVDVDLSELIESEIGYVEERYPRATLRLTESTDSVVSVDSGFHYAIRELLENGVVHNESTPPTVEAGVTRENGTYVVRVVDDGPGIPDAELEVVLSGGETPLEHASGLGLWFVNWLVTRSGGRLEIDARESAGTRVNIHLPAG